MLLKEHRIFYLALMCVSCLLNKEEQSQDSSLSELWVRPCVKWKCFVRHLREGNKVEGNVGLLYMTGCDLASDEKNITVFLSEPS